MRKTVHSGGFTPSIAGWTVLLSMASPTAAQEQSGETASEVSQKAFCLNGAPRAKCASILLTEVGISQRIATSRSSGAEGFVERGGTTTALSLELGLLLNPVDRHSIGGALYFRAIDADRERFGLRLRYRYWLDDGWGLDVGGGVIATANDIGATDATRGARILGFSGLVRMNYRDLIGVGLEMESIDTGRSLRQTDWFATARVGSVPGRVAFVALLIATLIGGVALAAG